MNGATSNAVNKLRSYDFSNDFIQNGKIKIIERRKDVRQKFNEPLDKRPVLP